MKKEELTALGLTSEQADQILAINERDTEKHKTAAENAKAQVTTLTQQLADRDADLQKLQAAADGAEAVQRQLTDLQAKYTADTQAYEKQIADRDYADALTGALQSEKVAFTSKAAETAVRNALLSDRLTLKDGKLEGFAGRLKALKESDPDAFRSETPPPYFSGPVGSGGAPAGLSRAAAAARAAGARFAPAAASNDTNTK